MEHINKVELRGRIGSIRTNEYNGSKVANFSVATDILYKTRDGGAVSETTWHNIVAWEGKDIADINSLEKGMAVSVTGRLRTTKYTSIDGSEKQFYEVLANKVKVIENEDEM